MLFPMKETFSCQNKLLVSSPWVNNSIFFLFILDQELLSRTTLETQKLDLMAEISTLKLKLTSVEKDRLDYEDRFRDTEVSKPHQDKLWKLCVSSHYLNIFWDFFFFGQARRDSSLRLEHVPFKVKSILFVKFWVYKGRFPKAGFDSGCQVSGGMDLGWI